ncbi:hypothetical protein B5S32_g4382 [[Candida] boidinii]|nr:hypothetical protein B5S32_g4382 [[Candida] boidinii]
MAPIHIVRPENILKRAEDLIAVDQNEAALETLYNFITSKRTRAVQPSELEPIAFLFIELGIKQRDGKIIKDGLHQYKRNVQGNEYGLQSVEAVVKKFIELAELRLTEAQEKANEIAIENEKTSESTSGYKLGDLDGFEIGVSPEDILMSSVSTEDSRDRSDREIVSPWLKFLWEAYRTVLDILRNNSKLQIIYSQVVYKAFNFCIKYERKTEFRRLCELLRTHLQTSGQKQQPYNTFNKQQTQLFAIDLSDAETLQNHLDVRFQQLNVSVKLELWQESFKSVEDVHTLLTLSKRQPKPSVMVNYYENVAKIFSVSGNNLFHAAAKQKYFNLFSQSPIATIDELKKSASVHLLSALSISNDSINDSNNDSNSSSNGSSGNDDYRRRQNNRLASLLNLIKVPTRDSILQQIVDKNVLKISDNYLTELYYLLEENLNPLTFASKTFKIFEEISKIEEYQIYIESLIEIILTKLFKKISEIYESIKLDYLIKLSTFSGKFKLSSIEIESFLVKTAAKNLISVKIDHDSRIVSFKSDPFDESLSFNKNSNELYLQSTPAQIIREQLSSLAKSLSLSVSLIDPSIKESMILLQNASIKDANFGFEDERNEILQRSNVLKNRIEDVRKSKFEEDDQANKERAQQLLIQKKEEQERLEKNAAKLEEENKKKKLAEIKEGQKAELMKEINSKGNIKIDEEEAKDLDVEGLRQLQIQKLKQDNKNLEDKLTSTAKRFDYIERAYRKSELPLLEKDAEEQKTKDLEAYELTKVKIIENAKKEHEESIKLRDRLKKVLPDYENFVNDIKLKHKDLLEKIKEENKVKLENAKKERIAQFIADKKLQFEKAKEEKARQAKIEAEKLAAQAEAAKRYVPPSGRNIVGGSNGSSSDPSATEPEFQRGSNFRPSMPPASSSRVGGGANNKQVLLDELLAIPANELKFAQSRQIKKLKEELGIRDNNSATPKTSSPSPAPAAVAPTPVRAPAAPVNEKQVLLDKLLAIPASELKFAQSRQIKKLKAELGIN